MDLKLLKLECEYKEFDLEILNFVAMFTRRIFSAFLVFVSLVASAQNKNPRAHLGSAPLSSSCVVANLPPDQPDTIFHLHAEPEEPGESDPFFIIHKHRLPNSTWSNYFEVPNATTLNKTNSGDLQLGTQKKYGIYTMGTPPDNAMAISNGGKIVASINTRIGFYDSTINILRTQLNTATFLADGSLQSDLFDPRVIYDPKSDRFISVVLSGNTDATSKVIIGFSQSNDPIGAWKFYKLAGNFDGSQSWFDYPNIAVTDNELIITGNLFYTSGGTFNQAVIVQINKADGINGAATLNYKVWDNITDAQGQNAFTIVPAINGTMQSYGPNFYLISMSSQASTVLSFYEITNSWNSSSSQLIIKSINVDLYSTPPSDSRQKGTARLLDIKKTRIRSAYYANGLLHYAYSTPTNTFGTVSAIAFGRYDIATASVKQVYIGQAGYNFAFPAIMHFSNLDSKNVTLLTYLASGNLIYPEIRALAIDENMQPSAASTQVKSGESYINYGIVGSERWGDYTGIARRYNSNTPETWIFGCYGETTNKWGNYLAQVFAEKDIIPLNPLGIPPDSFYLSPNPALRYLDLNITTGDSATFGIKIYSLSGQLVLEDKTLIPKGKHLKTYDLIGLTPEEYIIRVSKNEKEFKPTKFILLSK
jgi:hypothetical protein